MLKIHKYGSIILSELFPAEKLMNYLEIVI